MPSSPFLGQFASPEPGNELDWKGVFDSPHLDCRALDAPGLVRSQCAVALFRVVFSDVATAIAKSAQILYKSTQLICSWIPAQEWLCHERCLATIVPRA